MILDEDGTPFDHRDHCDSELTAGDICYAHMSPVATHEDAGRKVCDWFAGMWAHDCCNGRRVPRAERRIRRHAGR